MYFLAGEYVKQLQRRQPELDITDSDVLCVQIAALCFNLGYGPFSYTFELFLDEIYKEEQIQRPWSNVSKASVLMFEYMLQDNEDLMASFKRYFDNPKEDTNTCITFIKDLMREKRKAQLDELIEDKEFLSY
ncbi:PREDICTED: deoxynucleoside triphosphate triphosphohydrolase SAMHD1-like [Amphimedon queenslandica]|uniref:Uncharacterized protein n=1 Tax=Amphimedon queenslandica TaxID=400682 RepID=A0AAN0JSZ2_AMPQE|nr:PREDICTED: deoxynucleoside triphosphate triphosphohydrolase SAMHD1-like [Amphimedon queenslandica]|eukprot:XP_019860237.1 PREDICTED: deoxynucleoside triphosphate triphosphohydrolase SAMHD1-like [Amphimedon queenslandica]